MTFYNRVKILGKFSRAKTLINLGATLYELNRFEEAEVVCKEALLLNADDVMSYTNLGNILIDLDRLDEAADQCEALI